MFKSKLQLLLPWLIRFICLFFFSLWWASAWFTSNQLDHIIRRFWVKHSIGYKDNGKGTGHSVGWILDKRPSTLFEALKLLTRRIGLVGSWGITVDVVSISLDSFPFWTFTCRYIYSKLQSGFGKTNRTTKKKRFIFIFAFVHMAFSVLSPSLSFQNLHADERKQLLHALVPNT